MRLMKHYQMRRNFFKGNIGSSKYSGARTITKTYAGTTLFCSNVVGGVIKLKGINTVFEASGTITLYIYDNNGTLHETITLNTTAGKVQNNLFPSVVELPLHDGNQTNLQYHFVYEYSPANKPKSNKLSCGCGGDYYYFNPNKPEFRSKATSKWKEWVMATGFTKNSLDFVDDINDVLYDETTNGLILNLEFACKVSETLCKESLDFDNDPLAISIAYAIQHKAAEHLLNDILSSGDINRYSLINTDDMLAASTFHADTYKEHIDYIVQEAHIDNTDCLTCRDSGISKRGILS